MGSSARGAGGNQSMTFGSSAPGGVSMPYNQDPNTGMQAQAPGGTFTGVSQALQRRQPADFGSGMMTTGTAVMPGAAGQPASAPTMIPGIQTPMMGQAPPPSLSGSGFEQVMRASTPQPDQPTAEPTGNPQFQGFDGFLSMLRQMGIDVDSLMRGRGQSPTPTPAPMNPAAGFDLSSLTRPQAPGSPTVQPTFTGGMLPGRLPWS